MAKELDERFDRAAKGRDELIAKKQRVEWRLEAAKTALAEVEAECRAKGIEPADLEAKITQMDDLYRASVETLEQGVAAGEAALAPFLKES